MINKNHRRRSLEDLRERYPKMFSVYQLPEAEERRDPWAEAEARAEGHDRELLKTLHQRLEASGGGVKLELTPAGARLDLDPAWASAHGEAALDITALVYGVGAAAVRRWLLPTGENIQ